MKGSFGIEISRSQQSVGILRDRQIGSCPPFSPNAMIANS